MNDNYNANLPVYEYEWNNNCNGTYSSWQPKIGYINLPIPFHPEMNKIYDFVFDYALEGYTWANCSFEKCIEQVEEKFGKLTDEVKDYLKRCPYDAGHRAGMLIEEPDHYE